MFGLSKLYLYGMIAVVALAAVAGIRLDAARDATIKLTGKLKDADEKRADDIRSNAASSVRNDTAGYRD
jgi:hypothetical protein